jgi:hypothetical protein
VIEVPEVNDRQRQESKVAGLLAEALGLQAISAGGLEDVGGVGAVARDAAGDAQLLQ